MADPVTASVVILAINELGPPIAKESIASHIKRCKEQSDMYSTAFRLLDVSDTVSDTFVAVASALDSICPLMLIIAATEGTIKGIKKYSES